ncbi:hypothetical protein CBM2634_P150009 [Cupriavidus taiwanensis]|uniref:Uncharacterized protein n=1 Tax=Cupriavidus taiwanensis TaxID=164546 RepID=A0A375JAQ4_9BURK|nr:hypothetical protein CBM2634_P150009 [Cupriavidus taiwanensis]
MRSGNHNLPIYPEWHRFRWMQYYMHNFMTYLTTVE